MSEYNELVKRLREYGHSLRAGLGFKHMPELFNEAADFIEVQAAEIERLRGTLGYLRTQAKNGTLHSQVVIQNANKALEESK